MPADAGWIGNGRQRDPASARTPPAQDDILEASGWQVPTVPMLMPNGPAANVGLEFGAQAGVHSVASACATGAEAIALGLDLIRAGRADVVIAGGTEAVIHPLPIAGFAAMRAMSTRNDEPEKASRPWDKGRDGFVLGEGAAIVVLERADHAAARGARVYARLAGSGITSDGYDIVQRTHCRFVRAVRGATDAGRPGPTSPSTPMPPATGRCGRARSSATIRCSPDQSMTGHLLGGRRLETRHGLADKASSIIPETAC
jgi:3-oxoacyl-[acyl-carrier-protein] synthase II